MLCVDYKKGVFMELKEYLEQLEYLVNIDSGTFDVDGVNKIVQYFKMYYI